LLRRIDHWLSRAMELESRRVLHQTYHDRLVAEGRTDDTTRWQIGVLDKLLAGIAALPMASMRRRRGTYAALPGAYVSGDFASRWREALERIGRSPRYAGLSFSLQLGLVPLGPDKRSGLWEFAQFGSGTIPTRQADGRLALSARSAIVLVLIPAGTFQMGARAPRPGEQRGPNVDPHAQALEQPVHSVKLDAFLMAKYELTRWQWITISAGNNRMLKQPRHPVTNISWTVARMRLARLGLLLPTEAQWEYSARAGSSTIWWCGDDPTLLASRANLADRQYHQKMLGSSHFYEKWDDGHPGTAPVGSYHQQPNAFGLYDVVGNVWEWCRDAYAPYSTPVRSGDGLRKAEGPIRIERGGGWRFTSKTSRSAQRSGLNPDSAYDYLGLRPSRIITR